MKRRGLVAGLILVLVFAVTCSMLTPRAGASAGVSVTIHSRENNGASQYIGRLLTTYGSNPPVTWIFGGVPLNAGFSGSPWTIQYVPEPGFYFHRWVTEGGVSVSNPNANPTIMTLQSEGVLRIIYGQDPPLIGGVILPPNPFTALAPYLAMICLVATAAVAVKKRRS